jgi:hypothetical protein
LSEYRYSAPVAVTKIETKNLPRKGVDSSVDANPVVTELVVTIYAIRAANNILAAPSSLFGTRFTCCSSLLIKLAECLTDVIFACSMTLMNA